AAFTEAAEIVVESINIGYSYLFWIPAALFIYALYKAFTWINSYADSISSASSTPLQGIYSSQTAYSNPGYSAPEFQRQPTQVGVGFVKAGKAQLTIYSPRPIQISSIQILAQGVLPSSVYPQLINPGYNYITVELTGSESLSYGANYVIVFTFSDGTTISANVIYQ
ncbi:DUF973 family protein, partial [Acidianus sp. RZ1]